MKVLRTCLILKPLVLFPYRTLRDKDDAVTEGCCSAEVRCCYSWAALERAPGATTRPSSPSRPPRNSAGLLSPTFASARSAPATVKLPSPCRRRRRHLRRRIFSLAPVATSKSATSTSAIRSRREPLSRTSPPQNSTTRLRKPRPPGPSDKRHRRQHTHAS